MFHVYSGNTTNFANFGLAVIEPLEAKVKRRINDIYSLSLTIPFEQADYIENDNIIMADRQLYRIIKIRKVGNDKELIEVYAENIVFCDLIDDYESSFVYADISITQALTYLLSDTIFSVGLCDDLGFNYIGTGAKNKLEILKEILSVWQGELYINGLEISVKSSIGNNNGIRIQQGKNLKGIEYTEDISNVVTRLNYANKDGSLGGSVDSLYISNYSKIKNGYQEFDAKNQIDLDNLAQEYLQLVDKPYINYSIDLVELEYTKEYANYKDLEHIELGDTVTVKHSKLGIDIQARILETEEDILEHINNTVVLGNFTENYFDFQVALQATRRTVDYSFDKERRLNWATLKGLIIPDSTRGVNSLVVGENGEISIDATVILSPTSVVQWGSIDTTGASPSDVGAFGQAEIETFAIDKINATYIDANGVWTPSVYAENINTNNAKISTAQIETLEVGSNVLMGVNATISWNKVTEQPTIINENTVTTITNNTIQTTSIVANNLRVYSANIQGVLSANQIATNIAQVNSILNIGSPLSKDSTLYFYNNAGSFGFIQTENTYGSMTMYNNGDLSLIAYGSIDLSGSEINLNSTTYATSIYATNVYSYGNILATQNWVASQGYTSNTGDITAVYASTGLSGGASSGAATLGLNLTYTDDRYCRNAASGQDMSFQVYAGKLNVFVNGSLVGSATLS